MKMKKKEALTGIIFISLWIIGILAFILLPIIQSFYYSLCRYKVVQPPKFIHLQNYTNLLKDKVFLKAIRNTLYMICIGVPVTTFVSVWLSTIINNRHLRHTGLYKIVLFIPTLIPTVVACLLWIWMLQPETGIINRTLATIGIKGPGWIASTIWSKPAFILIMIWTSGNAIIIYLAGLQDIPIALYESASLDGAGFIRESVYITFPMLRPTILFNVITLIIGVFQWFAEPYIITSGGPNNSTMFYALYLYQNAFQFFKMGYASAMAWILLLMAMAIIVLLLKIGRFGKSDTY